MPWQLLVGLLAAGVAAGQGFSRFTYGLLLPRMVPVPLERVSTASLVAAFYAGATLCGVVALVVVARWFRPSRLLILGVGVSALSLLGIGLSNSLPVIAVWLAVAGLGGVFTYVPALTLAGSVTPAAGSKRRVAIAVAASGTGIGIVIARILALLLHAEHNGFAWRHVWFAEAALSGLVLCVLLALRSWMQDESSPGARFHDVARMPRWPTLAGAYLCFGITYSLYGALAVQGWERAGIAKSEAAWALAAVAPALAVGALLFAAIVPRLGRRNTLVISYVLLALSAAQLTAKLRGPWPFLSAVVFGLVAAAIPSQVAEWIQRAIRKSAGVRRPNMRTAVQRSESTDTAMSNAAGYDISLTVFGVVTIWFASGAIFGSLVGSLLVRTGGPLAVAFGMAAGMGLLGAFGMFLAVGRRGA